MSAPQISIISPTYNERSNLGALVTAIRTALEGVEWELIVVDDHSPDGTAQLARKMAREEPRLRCLYRIGRRGLSTAAIEGFLSSSAPFIALIDADMQHDETRLPQMLALLQQTGAELVIGSRYVEGGSADGLSNQMRENLSRWGGALARKVLKAHTSDPMSGFFAMRRDVFEKLAPDLSGHGFKILVDILASADRPLEIAEVPYTFRERFSGTSKLDTAAKLDYLMLLLDKTIGRYMPLRFVLFSAVGTLGLGVHLATLALLHFGSGLNFITAQGLAAMTAMTTNFLLNNLITYRDRRLKGWRLLTGLVSFYLVCAVGLFANVGVASTFYRTNASWWIAGLFGALVSAVWNYAASSAVTWRQK